MNKTTKIIIIVAVVAIVIGGLAYWYWKSNKKTASGKPVIKDALKMAINEQGVPTKLPTEETKEAKA